MAGFCGKSDEPQVSITVEFFYNMSDHKIVKKDSAPLG